MRRRPRSSFDDEARGGERRSGDARAHSTTATGSGAPSLREQWGSRAPTVLAFASGVCAAAHELTWSRLLGRAVGNTAWGIGLTLGAFMAGSGLGGLAAARVLRGGRASPRGYAAAEIAIALGAVMVVGLVSNGPVSSYLGLESSFGLAVDVATTSVVALVPAIAMGAAYPLLVALAGTTQARSLYAAGLVGAVVGLLGTAVLVAPHLGLDAIGLLAAVGNVLVGLVALGSFSSCEAPPSSDARADRAPLLRFGAAGALGLGAQVVWNRCLVPYAGVALLTFASIVATYLLGQAAGFFLHMRTNAAKRQTGARASLVLAGPVALACLAPPTLLSSFLPQRNDDAAAWVLAVFLIVASGVLFPSVLLGFAQAEAIASVTDAQNAGRLVGWGTLLSALGSLTTSFVAFPLLGPRGTLFVLSALAALASALGSGVRWAAALLGLAATAIVAFASPGPAHFLGPEFDGLPALHVEHDVQDTTAVVVVESPVELEVRRLVANGVSYSGDSTFAQRYMRLLAHLPASISGNERALLVCVGTGTTLDALRRWGFRRIDAVDVGPSIRRMLPLFATVNHDVTNDPSVRWVIDDGARHLRTSRVRYDVITLEPPPPRAPGASSLYSVELYEAARERLRPGGTLAQWLPLHGLSAAEVESLLAAFVAVFPHASLHLAERNEAILLGRTTPFPEGLAAIPDAPRADLAEIGFRRAHPLPETWVADRALLASLSASTPPVRDAWPAPEHAPLGVASARERPLDALLERLAAQARPQPGTWAAEVVPVLGAFYRAHEGTPLPGDRARVAETMRRWLAADPEDPYVQHVFGFGPKILERLERLRRFSPERIAELRATIEARRIAASRGISDAE